MIQQSSLWRIIDHIMSMVALGAFGGVLFLAAINLYAAGFYIDNLGYRCGAIIAWIGASITLVTAIITIIFFFREYRKQRRREKREDIEKGPPAQTY